MGNVSSDWQHYSFDTPIQEEVQSYSIDLMDKIAPESYWEKF